MLAAIFPGTTRGVYPLQSSVMLSSDNYSFELKADRLQFFKSHKRLVKYWNYVNNTLCMQDLSSKEYYLVNNQKAKLLDSTEAERILNRNVEQVGNYNVTAKSQGLFQPKFYTFEQIQTGEKKEFSIEGTLVSIINECFYFNILIDNKIIK